MTRWQRFTNELWRWVSRVMLGPPSERAWICQCKRGQLIIPMNPEDAESISAFLETFNREGCTALLQVGRIRTREPLGEQLP